MSGGKYSRRFVTSLTSMHLIILRCVSNESIATASQLSKALDIPRTSLTYHLKNLEFSGYLRSVKDTGGVFFALTVKGGLSVGASKTVTNGLVISDEQLDRAHNIVFKSEIVRMAQEKDLLKFGFTKGDGMKNWGQWFYGFRLQHCAIQITPQSFIFHLDEMLGNNAHTLTMIGFDLVCNAIRSLEEDLPGLRLGKPERQAIIIRQHHALQDDYAAQSCRKKGITIKTPRFEIDSSKGKPEIDFVDNELAAEHFHNHAKAREEATPEGYIDLVESTSSGQFSPSRATRELEKLTEIAKDTKDILERLVPGGTPPGKSDPGAMHG